MQATRQLLPSAFCLLLTACCVLLRCTPARAAEGVAVLEDLLATQRYADVITEADSRLEQLSSVRQRPVGGLRSSGEERPSSSEERQMRYLKALALMKLQRWDEATAIFAELAAGTDRTAELAALRAADVVLLRGAPEDAAPRYEAFLTKCPQSAYRVQAAFGLAKSYLKAGRWDQANTQLEAIRSEYPESFEARMAEDFLVDGLEFSVQVGSFRRPEFAQDLVDGLREKGCDAYVKMTRQGTETFYRVRVGHFRERGPAEVMERQLRGQGFATRLVP